jgi:UDP-N-acetylglucosamine diphosphorylase/glucosamine-1-phosphate N-acetyltransferase
MDYILFDTQQRQQLLPFTHTRPIADIRCGIMTMRERWELLLQKETSTLTQNYLQEVFPLNLNELSILINASIFATSELVAAIQQLKIGEKLIQNQTLIAANIGSINPKEKENAFILTIDYKAITYPHNIESLDQVWDIFTKNERAIQYDFELLTQGKKSAIIPDLITTIAPQNIFIEEGAVIRPCILNAQTGPIYIGKNAEIMEGCMIRGPLALGENSVLKMGAKIYGATTIGPGCKVGGEVNNSVFFANSNKGHDGFIGNAVIGEWCNLGADTNCSNLKNNYDLVKIWSESEGKLIPTGLQFCGLIMGDHSKTAINTMFNTGTIVGVSANVFGNNFPPKFVPSFSWGMGEEMVAYDFDKAMETASRMMERRGIQLDEKQKKVYQYVHQLQ